MARWLFIFACAMAAASTTDCQAQWYGYGNGWGYDNWGGSTPYSNAVRSEAALTMAQGMAAESYAKAVTENEQARSVYLDNVAKFDAMRREYKAGIEQRKEQRIAEQKARAASRPPVPPATVLYPRLSSDQLDSLTGEIHWPDSLMGAEYNDDRKVIEGALKSQAEIGPDDRSSKIIYDAAHRMMATRSQRVSELGSAGYLSCRKFLNSLAIEGDHAREASK